MTAIQWRGGRPLLIPLVVPCKVADGLARTARRRLSGDGA